MGIGIGLVGLGAFGSEFAPLFKSHPLVDRIALCYRELERVARFVREPSFKAKLRPSDAFTSLDEICKARLDAVVLITQPWLHAPQAIQIMESGKHVYSAVPIVSLPDADEILEWCDRVVRTCARTGMRYMLGGNHLFPSPGHVLQAHGRRTRVRRLHVRRRRVLPPLRLEGGRPAGGEEAAAGQRIGPGVE